MARTGIMARTGKTAVAALPQRSAAEDASFIQWFFRPAMLFRMSLVAGVFALWPYAAQKLPSLGTRPEYRIAFAQIQVTPPPEHPVPTNLIEQVAELSGMPQELSLLNENLTVDIAHAFRRHPWIARVIQVRKSFPAAIEVSVEYRKPVVMAQVPGGRIPLDAAGILLPTADFASSDSDGFPLIQPVEVKPKIRPGNVWNDPGILAAARLAALLGDHWKSLKLAAISIPSDIDAATDANDVILALVGRDGSRVVWGRPPGNDHPGELEATQKIRRLEKYLADYGDYGQPNGPYEIDIRHWQEITRRPLAQKQLQAQPAKVPKPDPKEAIRPKLREAKSPKSDRRK